MEIQMKEEATGEDTNVKTWPVLNVIERNPFNKNAVPPAGINVTIKEVAMVETKYKKQDGTPRMKLLIRTDMGDIWAPWREVNDKLKVWWGGVTKDWEGKSFRVYTEKILVAGEKKLTLVFEKV